MRTIIYYPPIEISNQYSSSCHAMCHINYLYSLFIYNLYYLALYYYLTTRGKYITPKMKTQIVFTMPGVLFSVDERWPQGDANIILNLSRGTVYQYYPRVE